MKIENFKAINKSALIASFDINFDTLGFTIRDFKLMDGNKGRWLATPSKSYKDQEGKDKYWPLFVVREDKKQAFEQKVYALLEPFLKPQPASPSVKDDLPF